MTSKKDLMNLETKAFIENKKYVKFDYVDLEKWANIFSKGVFERSIDHMTKREIQKRVDFLFKKYGQFSAGSPEFYELGRRLKEMGFSSIHEAGKYRHMKRK